MEQRVVGDLPLILRTKCPSCIQVRIISWKITARHLDPELVACRKHLGCRLEINFKAIDLPWVH